MEYSRPIGWMYRTVDKTFLATTCVSGCWKMRGMDENSWVELYEEEKEFYTGLLARKKIVWGERRTF
jgi:hypothetical protein